MRESSKLESKVTRNMKARTPRPKLSDFARTFTPNLRLPPPHTFGFRGFVTSKISGFADSVHRNPKSESSNPTPETRNPKPVT